MTEDRGSTDPRTALGQALDQAGMIVARITPNQATYPTPCASWDVGEVANHLINGLDRLRSAAEGKTADWSAPRPDVQGDWAAEFRQRADALTAVWAAVPDMSGTVSTQGGDLPRTFIAWQHVAEVAQHTWDLAAATGQRDMLSEEVAAASLDWARQALKPEYRGPEDSGKAFGEERPPTDDVPMPDRLAAFFGRDPKFVGESG